MFGQICSQMFNHHADQVNEFVYRLYVLNHDIYAVVSCDITCMCLGLLTSVMTTQDMHNLKTDP